MSHYPPGGPPPPYYGYPAPRPPTPGYTYVPTPVVMPMPVFQPPVEPVYPPPQPTYVTNYIYQQPPAAEAVSVVENSQPSVPSYSLQDLIDWVPCTGRETLSLSHRAVVGGKEGWDSSPLWVIRAHHSGDLIPGKLAVKHRAAFIPHSGREVPVHNFEVLCAPSHAVRWLPSSNGQVPVGAIDGGNTHSAEPLYIGRTRHMGSITPGKVHPSHGCLYISFEGKELSFRQYEVLCKIVG